MVCGGKQLFLSPAASCFAFDYETSTWSGARNLTTKRNDAASSVHPDLGLVVTGGMNGHSAQSSVEATLEGVDFRTDLAPMPRALERHCQVGVKESS